MGYFHNDRQQRGRIAELEAINEQHRKLNGELREEIARTRRQAFEEAIEIARRVQFKNGCLVSQARQAIVAALAVEMNASPKV